MLNKTKAYVAGGHTSYINWMECGTAEDISSADFVVFTGGVDVNPTLYGESRHPYTQPPDDTRDGMDTHVYMEAMAQKKPLVGICRGAQFLCVMAGGKLVQHQQNIKSRHDMFTLRNRKAGPVIMVTSDHHQAQFPWGGKVKFELLGFTWDESMYHEDAIKKEIVLGDIRYPEVEDAFYPEINALAIQSHPEWMYKPHGKRETESIDYYKLLLRDHLLGIL